MNERKKEGRNQIKLEEETSEDENLEDMMNDLRKDKLRHMSLHGTESTQNSPT